MQTNPTDITQTNAIISLIDDAIADSLGPDWTSFDAAHHVFQWLQDAGLQIVPAAFAEREARLVGAITSADAIVCTPNTDGSHKITLHYPDTSTAMAAFVQLSDVADGGMKDRTHG